MKYFLFILLLCCVLHERVAAQRNKPIIDSIERVLKTQKDTTLVKSYSELTWQYRLVNRDKAIDYGRKAIGLGKKLNYQRGLAQAYNDLGIIYYDKEQYDSAIALYSDAVKIRQQLNDYLGLARLYNKIGIVYQKQGKFSEALYNQQQALALFEKVNNLIGISYSLNNIGILQQNLGRYEEAIRYHTQSIAIKKQLNDKDGLLQSYVNVGNIYKIQEEYNKAESYYADAVALARESGNKEYLSTGLNNLGDLYIRKKQYNQAKAAIKESLELRTALGDKKGMSSCLNHLGDILIDEGKYDSAATLLNKGEAIARSGINTKPELLVLYQTQSKLYERKADAPHSLDYYKKYASLKDSLFNDGLSSRFSELETQYQTLQKEKTIQQQQTQLTQKLYEIARQKLLLSESDLQLANSELEIETQNQLILRKRLDSSVQAERILSLNKQNQINALELSNQKLEVSRKNALLTVLALCIGVILLLVFSYYRRNKLKQEKRLQATVMKQQELAAKAVMEAEENERKRIAGDLHDGVGQMMSAAKMNLSAMEAAIPFTTTEQRLAYEKVLQLVDESCREVRTVSHNMMPNALLKAGLASAVREFVNQIDSRVIKIDLYTEGLNEKLDGNLETVLYRVIQECVNNVIKHSGANHLDISLIKDEDGIAATIEDNGKGFNTADIHKFEGIGLKNMQSRISYLKGSIEWHAAPGKGTLVAIHVPC